MQAGSPWQHPGSGVLTSVISSALLGLECLVAAQGEPPSPTDGQTGVLAIRHRHSVPFSDSNAPHMHTRKRAHVPAHAHTCTCAHTDAHVRVHAHTCTHSCVRSLAEAEGVHYPHPRVGGVGSTERSHPAPLGSSVPGVEVFVPHSGRGGRNTLLQLLSETFQPLVRTYLGGHRSGPCRFIPGTEGRWDLTALSRSAVGAAGATEGPEDTRVLRCLPACSHAPQLPPLLCRHQLSCVHALTAPARAPSAPEVSTGSAPTRLGFASGFCLDGISSIREKRHQGACQSSVCASRPGSAGGCLEAPWAAGPTGSPVPPVLPSLHVRAVPLASPPPQRLLMGPGLPTGCCPPTSQRCVHPRARSWESSRGHGSWLRGRVKPHLQVFPHSLTI